MSLVEKQQIVVIGSGGMSTAYAIHEATQNGRLPRTEIAAIITSNQDAGAAFRNNEKGLPEVPIYPIVRSDYTSKEAWSHALSLKLNCYRPDRVGQYGWTPLTPDEVLHDISYADWINQHPGPVDPGAYDFGGKGMANSWVVCEAVRLFATVTGRRRTNVTAQRVGQYFDTGKVLKRSEWIPFDEMDDAAAISSKILPFEHQTQIALLQDFEEGKVQELSPHNDLWLPQEKDALDWAKKTAIAKDKARRGV